MYAICIECSPKRGLGHLFRSKILYDFFKKQGEDVLIIVNSDQTAEKYLRSNHIKWVQADLLDYESDWERELIRRYSIKLWVNDRMGTDVRSARNIKAQGVVLAGIDDTGTGAEITDFNFASMTFDKSIKIKGKHIYTGFEFIILDPNIKKYRHLREDSDKLVVSLGGSDTYGVTVHIARLLLQAEKTASIILGPAFAHRKELFALAGKSLTCVENISSLPEEFSKYDCAITGGGITAFEAAAAGIPTMIAANETHEIFIAQELQRVGASCYLGFRDNIDCLPELTADDIKSMSRSGLNHFSFDGVLNIYRELKKVMCG